MKNLSSKINHYYVVTGCFILLSGINLILGQYDIAILGFAISVIFLFIDSIETRENLLYKLYRQREKLNHKHFSNFQQRIVRLEGVAQETPQIDPDKLHDAFETH